MKKKRNIWIRNAILFFVILIIISAIIFIKYQKRSEDFSEKECFENIDCAENYMCEDKTCVPVGCVGEGEYTPGAISPNEYLHAAHECCEGLKLLTWDDTLPGCSPAQIGGGFLCTAKCGNYNCEPEENECTCPEDCTIYS